MYHHLSTTVVVVVVRVFLLVWHRLFRPPCRPNMKQKKTSVDFSARSQASRRRSSRSKDFDVDDPSKWRNLTELIVADLSSGSDFFEANPPRSIPIFDDNGK